MKCLIKILLLATTLVLFSACGDDSTSIDTNTTPMTCENNISWGSCGLPKFINNNNSNSYSSLGYYGDDVYLGDKKIVGSWTLYDIDENGSKIEPNTYDHVQYRFFSDGTGRLSSLQTGGHEITYGVATLGYSFITSTPHSAVNLPQIYSIYSQKDDCLLVVKQQSQYFLEATTHYFCKIR